MRTTVVPAQVTTVEDRIAGNFTFTQIILLIVPLLTSTAVYILIPPRSGFNTFKLSLIATQFLVFGAMAIRIKGKLLVEWLVILLRYKLRPRLYVFTKNDQAGREIANVIKEKLIAKEQLIDDKETALAPLSLGEQTKIGELIDNPSLTFRFELGKKGGIDVSLASTKD